LRPYSTSPRQSQRNVPSVVPPWSPVSSSTARQPDAGQRVISTATCDGIVDEAAVAVEGRVGRVDERQHDAAACRAGPRG
jgi:hypothetical protein